MHHYTVQNGDTPHSIARRFGIHVRQLIAANPNKPVVNTSGGQTWSALYPGERIRVPHRHELAQSAALPPPPQDWQQDWQRPWQQQQVWQPPTPQVPWWQQQQTRDWQQDWQRPWQRQQPPPPQPWQQQQVPPPAPAYHPGRFRFGPLHGVGDVLAGHRYEEALRQLESERLRKGRHDYEYGGNPYGVADGTGVGDAAGDAVQALLAAGDPCDPNNASLVCAVQSALGIAADGKWGAGTAKAAQAVFSGAPGACSPRPSWWAPVGQSNCGQGAPAPSAAPTVMPPLIIPTASLPAGSVPADPSGPPPVVPAPSAPAATSSAPPAVMAMASLDPCNAANVGAVCAAQAALGLSPDGKWGAGSARAAQAAFPGAPGACTPRPGWWAPKGQSNCGGAAHAPTAHGGGGFTPPPGGAPFGAPPSAPAQQASVLPGGHIVAPKGGGNAMAVAGVLGALGLVGIVAVVATGAHEKIITRYRTRRAPAPAPAPSHHRAPASRRAPARRLSRHPKRR
jgi:hypothetical protein